jgi:hypothetical protein
MSGERGWGDPGDPPPVVAAGLALRRRRRRLTLAPPVENRFALLHVLPEEVGVEEPGVGQHVAMQVAEEAIAEYSPRARSPEIRRPRKTDDELLAEFWADAGFPSPSSRFWERQSTPGSGKPGMVDNGFRFCRSSSSSPPATSRRAARGGVSSASSSPVGLCLSRPPRVGSW